MRLAPVGICLVLLARCASDDGVGSSPSPTVADGTNPLFGDWAWVRSCDAVVEQLRDAGLADRIRETLVEARYFPREDVIDPDRPCRDAEQTRYVYFFEEPGRWGVLDDDEVLVDDRGFELVDGQAITFDDIEVTFEVGSGDRLTFEVHRPTPCDATCVETHVWAVATFAAATLRRVA